MTSFRRYINQSFYTGINNMINKIGTKEKPLSLKTPPLSSEYTMHVEEKDGKEVFVGTVGKTVLYYNINCISDLHTMFKKHGD